MSSKSAVIIITYNSEPFLDKAVDSIRAQSVPPDQILIVDTGSHCRKYLTSYEEATDTEVLYAPKNAGFCRGNNLGYAHLNKDIDYVLLLNPDAFLFPDFIENAINFMQSESGVNCGIATGVAYGYDIERDQSTGLYDTTGIFKRWYGKWYDRGQGLRCNEKQYQAIEEVPAVCGALMFCRKKALDEALLPNQEIFDSRFYMYKEDIDLSLRLKRRGWSLIYTPALKAYHCRGWSPDRKKMTRKVRLLSARNELRIHSKSFSPFGIMYSMLKYASVFVFDL